MSVSQICDRTYLGDRGGSEFSSSGQMSAQDIIDVVYVNHSCTGVSYVQLQSDHIMPIERVQVHTSPLERPRKTTTPPFFQM
jgi:hypothetical protein